MFIDRGLNNPPFGRHSGTSQLVVLMFGAPLSGSRGAKRVTLIHWNWDIHVPMERLHDSRFFCSFKFPLPKPNQIPYFSNQFDHGRLPRKYLSASIRNAQQSRPAKTQKRLRFLDLDAHPRKHHRLSHGLGRGPFSWIGKST